jgi:hypothetical protein
LRHEKSQVESSEHQDNPNIHDQPFPESVSEERKIYTDYNGRHRHHVKHYSYPSIHFSTTSLVRRSRSYRVDCGPLGEQSTGTKISATAKQGVGSPLPVVS